MTTEVLNNSIDNTNNAEMICNEVLEVLYYKYDQVPKIKHVEKEIAALAKKDNLLESDEMFLVLLRKAFVWFHRVPLGEYLNIWCLDNHIPYKNNWRECN